jgi:hypothetical protein
VGRTDVLGWAVRNPGWFGTFLVMGLITLIPIVGTINLYGWMMTCVDNFRAGRTDLPPAGFYLSRGWRLFVVQLVYGLVPAVVFVVLFLLLFVGAAASSSGGSSASGAAAGLLSVLIVVLYGLLFLVVFILQGLVPLLGLATDRYGIAGALNPMLVIGWIQARTGPTLIAMLLGIAAQFIAQVGVYVCFVGVFVTLPFGYAMLAGVIRNLELDLSATAPAAPPAPAG